MKVAHVPGLHPSGNVGVFSAPGSVRVLLLLPARRHRLLCTANRDHRPRLTGVHSPRVGPGDGGPGDGGPGDGRPGPLPKLRGTPSFKLRLPRMRTCLLEHNWERQAQSGKEARRGQKAQPAFGVHLQSHVMTLQFRHYGGFKGPGSTRKYVLLYSLHLPLLSQCCH